jgi:hypothetical protein
MRKIFSILFPVIILVAGMHVTVATHFCGGKIAATRVSFSGRLASCGMASDSKTNTSPAANYTAHCCDNIISQYAVDNNYIPAEFHAKEIIPHLLHDFYVPAVFSFKHKYPFSFNFTNTGPPSSFSANAVSMADICVFRI